MYSNFFQPMPHARQKKHHFTQFLLDFMTSTGEQEKLTDYMIREANYDVAFIQAFLYAFEDNQQLMDTLETPHLLMKFLDNIQSKALSHLPKIKMINKNAAQLIHGKAFMPNFYGLSKDWNSDEEGICDLVKLALDPKINRHLVVHYDNAPLCYVEKNGYFRETDEEKIQLYSAEQTQEITAEVLKEYRKGPLKNQHDRLVLFIVANEQQRHELALESAAQFQQTINQCLNDAEKIETIGRFIKELMQLHLYCDGNGRSLFILANRLLTAHGLKPFYPTQLCPFDGNSLEKMGKEISEGQKRFTQLFGSHEQLCANLNQYKEMIDKIAQMIQEMTPMQGIKTDLMTPFKERNFNLLLRRTATSPDYFSLFKLLLDNCDLLNIDINEKGLKSGNVWDVALQFNNQKAIEALTPLFIDTPINQANKM